MTSRSRLVLAVACGVLLLASATVAAGAWLVYGPGSVCIQVHERDGADVSIRVPAVLVRLAVGLIPSGAFPDRGDDLREALPLLLGVCNALDRVEDAVLVEIERPGEHVRIANKGGRLLVSVESAEESVRLEIPLVSVRWLADKIERDLPDRSGRPRA